MSTQIFEFLISTPANTLESAKVETTLPMGKGILHRLEILFPAGSNYMLFLNIFENGEQILPKNAGGYFLGENRTLKFDTIWYELQESSNFTFIAKTWAPGTTYAHNIIANFTITEREILAGLW